MSTAVRLPRSAVCSFTRRQQVLRHHFSTSTCRRTDGVFRELTSMRVQTPWVDALRRRDAAGKSPPSTTDKSPMAPKPDVVAQRKMSDSFHSVILPLNQDPWLLDTYMNSTGHIRLGTLLMDLDALAGIVAAKHAGDGVTTVTAAVDRITIQRPLTEICDLELSGKVTYASGRSSMEVTLQVAVAPKPGATVMEDDVMMTCQFVMVSLDPTTRKATRLPATLAETKEEKALYAAGEKNSLLRKDRLKASLLKQAPNHEEGELIHAIWKKEIQWHDPNDPERKPDNVHFMETTKIQTTNIMQPQYRNRHHFMIFGGFLLKQTFELAFCCAASFTHARPTFVALDPSTFENPVPVGSVLYCTATVAYTDPPILESGSDSIKGTSQTRIQVRVDTKVRNVEHGETKPTGQFNYTFTVDKDIKVVPRTYSEFMMWTNGRRRAHDVEKSLTRGDADSGSTERVTE